MQVFGLRWGFATAAVILGVMGAASCGTATIPTAAELSPAGSAGPASGMEQQVLAGINEFRRSQSKPPFARSTALDGLARHHAQEMLKAQKISHHGFHLRSGAAEAYYGLGHLVENVYWSKGHARDAIPSAVVQGWIRSPGHRQNLLAMNSVCGVGLALGDDGQVYAAQLSGSVINRGGGF